MTNNKLCLTRLDLCSWHRSTKIPNTLICKNCFHKIPLTNDRNIYRICNRFDINITVNNVTIISKIPETYVGGWLPVLAKCFCGKLFTSSGGPILNGFVYSCGCLKGQETYNTTDELFRQSYINRVQKSAGDRNKEFQINKDDITDLMMKQKFLCALSGEPLIIGENESLDRIDSNIGYVVGNIQWITRKINILKRTLSDSELIDMCHSISDYQRSK